MRSGAGARGRTGGRPGLPTRGAGRTSDRRGSCSPGFSATWAQPQPGWRSTPAERTPWPASPSWPPSVLLFPGRRRLGRTCYWLTWLWPLLGTMVALTLGEMFYAQGYAFYLAAVLVVPTVGRLGRRGGAPLRRGGGDRQPCRAVGGALVAPRARLGSSDQHRFHRPHGVRLHRDHVGEPSAS